MTSGGVGFSAVTARFPLTGVTTGRRTARHPRSAREAAFPGGPARLRSGTRGAEPPAGAAGRGRRRRGPFKPGAPARRRRWPMGRRARRWSGRPLAAASGVRGAEGGAHLPPSLPPAASPVAFEARRAPAGLGFPLCPAAVLVGGRLSRPRGGQGSPYFAVRRRRRRGPGKGGGKVGPRVPAYGRRGPWVLAGSVPGWNGAPGPGFAARDAHRRVWKGSSTCVCLRVRTNGHFTPGSGWGSPRTRSFREANVSLVGVGKELLMNPEKHMGERLCGAPFGIPSPLRKIPRALANAQLEAPPSEALSVLLPSANVLPVVEVARPTNRNFAPTVSRQREGAPRAPRNCASRVKRLF